MPIQFHKFDQQKIDNHHKHLESLATKGTPKSYEILVDGIKAVPKSDDPADFYKYEDYMTEDTGKIKIIIYGSTKSPRNDQFEYAMKAKNEKEAFEMGLDGFAGKAYSNAQVREMAEKRQQEKLEMQELESLRIKVVEQQNTIGEQEEEMKLMQKVIDKAEANGNKIGGLDFGTAISKGFELYVNNNAHKLAKIPGFEGLAGVFATEANGPSQPQENAEATFRKKETDNAPEITEREKEFIRLFHELEQVFSHEQMLEIIEILRYLAKDKSQLTPILELLEEKES